MTPKEKAEKLISKFSSKLPFYNANDNLSKAKQCALICVDEIQNTFKGGENEILYWEEVKQEIIKL